MSPLNQITPAEDHPTALQILLILTVGILAWSNSFFAPFVFDDLTAIVNNRMIRGLQKMLTDPGLILNAPRRYLGYLSFAFNYRISGLGTFGFHTVNLFLHLATALALFGLCRIAEHAALPDKGLRTGTSIPLPLAASLLFVCHPVQTQAVSYITQRFTVMATFFYLLALFCYAKGRTENDPAKSFFGRWHFAAIIAAVCAMLSKEIAFTLPVALLLLEIFLFKGSSRERFLKLAPFVAMLAIPLMMIFFSTDPELIMTKSGTARREYLITQSAVFLTYIRLILLPVNQTLDYDYPLYSSMAAVPVIAGTFSLLAMIALSILLYRRGSRYSRLAGLGISLYIVSLSVESLVPLADVINEHRLYLPLAGASLAASCLLTVLSANIPKRLTKLLFFLLVITLATATWKRNLIWSDELLLWSDTVAKAPGKARPHYNLGIVLNQRGLTEAAEQEFRSTLDIDPGHAKARYNLGVIKAGKGDLASAKADYEAAIRLEPQLAEAYNSLGVLLSAGGDKPEAISYYRQAVRLSPGLADARNNLGAALATTGDISSALQEFKEAVRLDPDNRPYRDNLERALALQGKSGKGAE